MILDKLNDPLYDSVQDNLLQRLANLQEQMTAFVKHVSRFCRTAASYMLVVMINTEDRIRKPYAMPVQCRGVGTTGARGASAPLLKKLGGLSPPAW